MTLYRERTGTRMTYDSLSAATGISVAALQSMGSRTGYNATLATVEKICRAAGCTPGELLEMMETSSEGAACP